MKRVVLLSIVVVLTRVAVAVGVAANAALSVKSAPPVVVKTIPEAGSTDIDPATAEIRVTFSKAMRDESWSWSTASQDTFPKTIGKPRYLEDGKTCVLTVALEPGRAYGIWLNSQKFHGFQDKEGSPAVPYLLVFETSAAK